MKVLLVGEDAASLRGLSIDLSLQGFTVRTASDIATLRSLLEDWRPDVVLLDHVEPMDVYALNPRESGYHGPLLLLVFDALPVTVLELLRAENVVRKPVVHEVLSEEIRLVVRRSDSAP